MNLTVLGCAASYPDAGVATSSYLVEHGPSRVLLDCGHGAVSQLRRTAALNDLSAVLISHLHPDHFFDLIALRNCWYKDDLPPIPLYVPTGGMDTLRKLLWALDLPPDYLTALFQVGELGAGTGIRIGGLQVETARANHHVETLMMRVSGESGGTIGYTADTGWADEVTEFFDGVNLLLAEATNFPMPRGDGAGFHLSPEESGKLFEATGASLGVVTHFDATYAEEIAAVAAAAAGGTRVELAGPLKRWQVHPAGEAMALLDG